MGEEIRQYPSNRTLVKIVGDEIREYPSNKTIAKVSNVKKEIDGAMGGKTVVAFWIAFVR